MARHRKWRTHGTVLPEGINFIGGDQAPVVRPRSRAGRGCFLFSRGKGLGPRKGIDTILNLPLRQMTAELERRQTLEGD